MNGVVGSGRCQIFRKSLTCYVEFIKNDFQHFRIFRQLKKVNHQQTTHSAHFEAPGMLKTAPAFIFHHIWYGKTKVSIIFDHMHCILHHMYGISYHIYGISYHICMPLEAASSQRRVAASLDALDPGCRINGNDVMLFYQMLYDFYSNFGLCWNDLLVFLHMLIRFLRSWK